MRPAPEFEALLQEIQTLLETAGLDVAERHPARLARISRHVAEAEEPLAAARRGDAGATTRLLALLRFARDEAAQLASEPRP